MNVQGDEPLIEPAMIDEAVAPFSTDPALMMSTLRRRIDDESERQNPNVTKVVVDQEDAQGALTLTLSKGRGDFCADSSGR